MYKYKNNLLINKIQKKGAYGNIPYNKTMLEEKVLKTIQRYNMLEDGDKVVIGVSGGPDSMTLLNILNNLKEKLNINLYVAHINHMIRKEADEETEYVKDFCAKINVEFFAKKIRVEEEAKKQKIGTEEAGRNIRYEFFEEVAKKVGANKIATAHNSNDNAETVLMNIIRGTSVSGLKGIDKVRDGRFIRPIIECSRDEIEEYCKEQNLNPKYDKTNDENIYTRNKIRNMLIPFLKKEFNPNIVDGINRLSQIATEEEQFINKTVEKEYERLAITENDDDRKYKNTNVIRKVTIENKKKTKDNSVEESKKLEDAGEVPKNKKKTVILDLKEFNKLDYVIKAKLILYTISKVYGSANGIEKIHIDDIIKLCSNNIGNKYLTPKAGIKVYVRKGKIYISFGTKNTIKNL